MLLAIDIGNTNVTLGVFRFEGKRAVPGPSAIWRLSTSKSQTEHEYGIMILDLFHYAGMEAEDIKGVAIASVVPALNPAFEAMVKGYFERKPYFIEGGTQSTVKVKYRNPGEVGADRIANAAAAHVLYGGAVIVLDFGTATTFDCVSARGEYLGGVIAPGPLISAESLARRTAKLPRVDVVKPERVIGRTTVEGIQSGIYYGYVGLIKEILKRTKAEIGGRPTVIATGGLAHLIVPEIREVRAIIPELTLEGIRILWMKNKPSRR